VNVGTPYKKPKKKRKLTAAIAKSPQSSANCGHNTDPNPNPALFYVNALIDTENAFLKFLKTHVDNVRKRTEKYIRKRTKLGLK